MKKRIAIFASGSGSNAENIGLYFQKSDKVEISCLLSNKSDAKVLKRAQELGIETFVFNKTDFYQTDQVLTYLQQKQIDWIILAGFLWLIPEKLIDQYPDRIINIHPALLPKYGGKGMYGHHVHQAVIDNRETESGITIHYVNKEYDQGAIIFQAHCSVLPNDDADTIARKIHALEYLHFPRVIGQEILK